MFKKVEINKSEFDLKSTLILANRKLSVDEKARAIYNLKRNAIVSKKSRF